MHPLTELVCGEAAPTTSSIGEILSHLSLTLDRLIVRSVKLRDTDEQVDIALFGPVLTRALLEVSFTALLGRLDPFRVLLVREFQKQSSYVVDRRSGVAFNWQPDVHGDKVVDLFKADLKLKDVPRALLGSYYQETFWREAFQSLLDTVPFQRGADWMSRLRLVDPETFASRARGESERIYTICSKGVHHEFVISPGNYYDKVTIQSVLQRCFELIGTVSITTNMCPTVAFRIPANRAIDLYEEAQEELIA